MRELTNKEQILVKALVKKGHPDDPSTIWDVLSSLYEISYAAKEEYRYSESTIQNLSKEERNRVFVEYWHNPIDNNFSRDFQEAISLILELVDKRYLTIKLFGEFSDRPLGEKQEYAILLGKEIVSQLTIYNYYQFDLWVLLNSHFMATNALVDYSKDFKTEEQRRFKIQLDDSNIKHKEVMIEAKKSLLFSQGSFLIAIISLIITIALSRCSTTKLDNNQFEELKQSISNSKTKLDTIGLPYMINY